MTTTWVTTPYKVVLRGLAKPYRSNVTEFQAGIRLVTLSNGDRDAEVRMASRDNWWRILDYLDKRGYINHAQEVELELIDNFLLQVRFVFQLPMGVTEYKLQDTLPRNVKLMCGDRSVVLGAKDMTELRSAATVLWRQLLDKGVVRGTMPAFWIAR